MNLLLHIILFHRKTSHDCQSKKYRNLLQHGQLITTNSLLTSLPNEINDNTINNVKHYSLIMCGVNYHREVYQNMDCKQLFYIFFDIVNERNVNGPIKYATIFLQQ